VSEEPGPQPVPMPRERRPLKAGREAARTAKHNGSHHRPSRLINPPCLLDRQHSTDRHFDDLDAVLESDPWTNFGNWFSPFNRRQVFAAAVTSLNTMSLAVVADRIPSSAPSDAGRWRTRFRSGLTCADGPSGGEVRAKHLDPWSGRRPPCRTWRRICRRTRRSPPRRLRGSLRRKPLEDPPHAPSSRSSGPGKPKPQPGDESSWGFGVARGPVLAAGPHVNCTIPFRHARVRRMVSFGNKWAGRWLTSVSRI
jgi:hypothetical protein